MKSEKRETMKGIGQLNQQKNWTLGEKENCKYLVILGADTIKQTEMKDKKKRVLKKNR